jgi:hypothetical protein
MEDLKDKGKGGKEGHSFISIFGLYFCVSSLLLTIMKKFFYPFVLGALDIMKNLGFNCVENPKGDFIGVMCIRLKY